MYLGFLTYIIPDRSKSLSENLYFRKDQLSAGQMKEGKVILPLFLPTNEESARTIDPGMSSLHSGPKSTKKLKQTDILPTFFRESWSSEEL
jgi:hypothetical protein